MRYKRKKSFFCKSSVASFFMCIVMFFSFAQTAYSYLALEEQLFIDAYKKVLSKAAVNLRNKKVRLRADIMGYEESEDSRKALERFKKEIKLYLEAEYQIDLISFVPVFSKKHYRTEGIDAPIVEFSFFADERLSLYGIAEDTDAGPSLVADRRQREELAAVKAGAVDGISVAPVAKRIVPQKVREKQKKVYSENELKSRKHNRAGVEHYKGGRYELAFTEFIDAVIVDPENVQTRFNLGVAYQMQGRYGEAVVEFEKALRIEDLPRIHVMLGAVYIMQERYSDAMEELKNVVFFGTEKTRIGPAGVQAIRQFSRIVKTGALQVPIRIEGHTDSRGTKETNRPISRDRAIAVAMELIAMNSIEPDFIFIRSLGEDDPVAPNSSRAGRRINRRVEMSIHKQEELH